MKYLVILLFLLTSNFAFTQNDKADIKTRFEGYRRYLEAKDYPKALSYYDSTFFRDLPYEKFKGELEKLDQSNKFEYFQNHSKIESLSTIKTIDSTKFCQLTYTSNYHYLINKDLAPEEKERIKGILIENEDNTTFKKGKEEVIISKKRILIGIKRNDNWYFIPYYEPLKPYLDRWFPQEAIDFFNL